MRYPRTHLSPHILNTQSPRYHQKTIIEVLLRDISLQFTGTGLIAHRSSNLISRRIT
ncbi:hypothetical protein RSAG8_12199, partial [Rhizoctonia solani AG-8 WAC10335]